MLNFTSVAGSNQSPTLAYVTVQPFVTVHLPARLLLASNAVMSFFWRGGQTTVPVNLQFGRAFGPHFVGMAEAAYVLAGAGRGDITAKAVLVVRF